MNKKNKHMVGVDKKVYKNGVLRTCLIIGIVSLCMVIHAAPMTGAPTYIVRDGIYLYAIGYVPWLTTATFKGAYVDSCGLRSPGEGDTVYVGWGEQVDDGYETYSLSELDEISGEFVIPSYLEVEGDFVTVDTIFDHAFLNNTNLTKVTLPVDITEVGIGAFQSCSKLESVSIFGSHVYVGEGAFVACENLCDIDTTRITSFSDGAFCGCSKLAAFNISDSVIDIGDGVFAGCESLKTISVPQYVCTNKISEIFSGHQRPYGREYAAIHTNITDIVVKDGVAIIGENFCEGCFALDKIVIPESIVSIASNAFMTCSNITEVTMPWVPDIRISELFPDSYKKIKKITLTGSIDRIPASAFEGCEGLIELTIPDGVVEIGASAFKGCKALKKPVELPNSVTNIGTSAFADCTGLESVAWNWWPWRISEIPSSLFKGCTNLTSVAGISSNIGRIGASAFEDCESLSSILLPSSVTNMGVKVFQGCSNLTSAQLPSNLKTIPDYTFNGCGKLQSVTMPSAPTSIGKAAFFGCLSITEIAIPMTVSEIGEQAFGECWELKHLDIPDGVTIISGRMCKGCSALSRITLPASITRVSDYAFIDCTNLKTIQLDDRTSAISVMSNSIPATATVGVSARSGYSFIGWIDENGTEIVDPFHIGENVTAFPTWKVTVGDDDEPATPTPVKWTVRFDLNGADAQGGVSSITISDGTTIGELPTPRREAYSFAGWWTAANGGTEVTAGTIVAADMTLFAHWTGNQPPTPTYTETTPVPVRHDWLEKYPAILSVAGSNYEAAAMRPTGKKDGKGNALCVWHDYLAGTDPTSESSVFRAKVEFENGVPQVGWEPDLNENGTKSERFYKVFGKKSLAANENWMRIADEADQKDYNFFKVTVNMEETPDTEEELMFGDGNETGNGLGEVSQEADMDARPISLEPFYSAGAESQHGYVRVKWYTNIDVDSISATNISFCVYRSSTPDIKNAKKIATQKAIRFNSSYGYDDMVDDYATYYYWVRAETDLARSEYSDCVSAAAKVPGPRNLTATTSRRDGVLLTWDAVSGVASYRIYADDNDTSNGWVFNREVGETTGTSYFDADTPVGARVVYKVVSMSPAADEYAYSTVYGSIWNGEYAAPTITLSSGDSLYVYVKEVVGATGYEIYRADQNNVASAHKVGEGSWFWDSTAAGGRMYYYWAKAVYEDGMSGFSEAVSGGARPSDPTNIQATQNRTDGIEVVWDVVDGAEYYKVYGRRASMDSDFVVLGTTTDNRWLDITVSPGGSAIYKVSAVAATGESYADRRASGSRAE